MLMVIYQCAEIIRIILATPNSFITYMIMQNIIQVNQLIYIYNH